MISTRLFNRPRTLTEGNKTANWIDDTIQSIITILTNIGTFLTKLMLYYREITSIDTFYY